MTLRYEFAGPDCGARLYRTPEDLEPILLDQPRGEVTVELPEPQWLFYELLDGSSPLSLAAIRFELL